MLIKYCFDTEINLSFRFEEAVEPLNRCLRMAGTLKLNVLTWPGTDTKMEESISEEIQVMPIYDGLSRANTETRQWVLQWRRKPAMFGQLIATYCFFL